MPKGRPKKTPEWAREDSEKMILDALKHYPDGLRISDLTKILEGKVHRNTILSRLKDLKEKNNIAFNKKLRRYHLSELSLNAMRKLEILDFIRQSSQFPQLKIEYKFVREIGFPSAFVKFDGNAEKLVSSMPIELILKRASEFVDIWLKDIVSLAESKHPIDLKDLDDSKLKRIWKDVFQGTEKILFVESIDVKELLEYCKTPEGKARLRYAITGDDSEIRDRLPTNLSKINLEGTEI